jgi:histidine triad (HIT) family protein
MAIKLSPEQQKAIEEQKANCPFCKIVKGDIPSKKVYEDADVQAVMDINPAAKGHMLVMPKEHYPIMPLIPEATFERLFSVTRQLSGCAQQAMLVPGSTVFIANGAAAGQQSQHFLLHLIPREQHDPLAMLDPPVKQVDVSGIEKAHADLRNNLAIMMRNHFKRIGKPFPSEQAVLEGISEERLIALIEANPPMLELALTRPDEFKAIIPKHPQLSVIFKGKDADAIIAALKKRHPEAAEKRQERRPQGEEERHEAHRDKDSPAGEKREEHEEAEERDAGNDQEDKRGGEGKVSLDDIAKLFSR